MNLNEFARKVTLKEGKKQSISIAQVKEVIKISFKCLSEESDEEILKLMEKVRTEK